MTLKIQTKPKPKQNKNRSQYGRVMAFVICLLSALFFLGGCSESIDTQQEETKTRYIDQAQIGAEAPFGMFVFKIKNSVHKYYG